MRILRDRWPRAARYIFRLGLAPIDCPIFLGGVALAIVGGLVFSVLAHP